MLMDYMDRAEKKNTEKPLFLTLGVFLRTDRWQHCAHVEKHRSGE